jgi:apolipoprotein D and lipocalin family protein
MRQAARTVAVGLACLALGGCALLSGSFGDLKTAPDVNIARYMGHWRVIAHIPYFAEAGCSDSIESYALRADGDIDNWFSCRKGSASAPLERQARARAHIENTATHAEWNVLFFHVLKIKYVVLAVDPQYQWAVVGHPSKQYGWIFSRTGTLPPETYDKALRVLADAGYDTARLERVPQTAEPLEPPPFQ